MHACMHACIFAYMYVQKRSCMMSAINGRNSPGLLEVHAKSLPVRREWVHPLGCLQGRAGARASTPKGPTWVQVPTTYLSIGLSIFLYVYVFTYTCLYYYKLIPIFTFVLIISICATVRELSSWLWVGTYSFIWCLDPLHHMQS